MEASGFMRRRVSSLMITIDSIRHAGPSLFYGLLLIACGGGGVDGNGEGRAGGAASVAQSGAGAVSSGTGAGGRLSSIPYSTGGRGGGNDSGGSGGTEPPTPFGAVVISEIMYHPVREVSVEDEHEFVEIHNPSAVPVSLTGWKLLVGSSERLKLPLGTMLAPGAYLVLAKRRDRLLAVPSYGLAPEAVVGDFSGGLGNGGSTVALLDAQGRIQDQVTYDDEAPWPVGADALGAQEAWLPGLAPLDNHQFMGRSLERYSPTLESSDPRNWEASPVDGATPGRPNSVLGDPRAIVLDVAAARESGTGPITASDSVRITATLSKGGGSELALEVRIDTVEKVGTTLETVSLNLRAGTESTYEATLPPRAANTVVRYRVVGNSGGSNRERIGPRPTDPGEFYAYFVSPPPPSGRSYHLFITPENWTTMYTNLRGGPISDCATNPVWNATVPAVFVYEGKVYDVQVRYQGSQNRRTDGIPLSNFDAPSPNQPSPVQVLSWRIRFPRYAEFEGFGGISMNKLKQGCPGVLHALQGALMNAAGVPSQQFRFARFYINGGYYSYSMDVRNLEEPQLEAYEGQNAIGDLFESSGARDDSDAVGRGDFTPLSSACGLPPETRYQLTYPRKTHDWKDQMPDGHQELIRLIVELDSIQATVDGDQRVLEYFNEYFDVPTTISQYAIRNWAGVWDDGTHNYLPYRRAKDGKWAVFAQDFDCEFGGVRTGCGSTASPLLSFFHPESGRGNTWGSPSRLKVQLIKAFRAEFATRVAELGNTLFSEQRIDALLGEILAGFDRGAWQEAPARFCDLDASINDAKQWLAERRRFMAQGVQ